MAGSAAPWPWQYARRRSPRRRARGARRRCTAVVAARHAGDPGSRDVRAGDGVPPAGLLLVIREIPQVAAGRPDPAGDPPQSVGPVPGAAHQVGDLRDVLVVLDRAVLAGAGLPRAGGDLPD